MIDAVLMLRGDLSVIVSRNANCISAVNTNLFYGGGEGANDGGSKAPSEAQSAATQRGVSVTSGAAYSPQF